MRPNGSRSRRRCWGRAGKEMGSLMALSAGDLKALEDEARKLGLVLSDEAAAKAEEFNDELERMRRALQVQATQGFLDALPARTTGARRLSPRATRYATWRAT